MSPETNVPARPGVCRGLRWAIFIGISLLALAIRLPQLGARPMHTDESVNAYITGQLLAGEGYHYDPRDRHGPALFAFTEPLVKLLGARSLAELDEWQLRLVPVILGCMTILLLGAGVEMFGFIACVVAALLFAVAPLPVYYNRYFIHETLFVAATLGLVISSWRAVQKSSVPAAAVGGLCAALMLASKETAVLHFFALSVAGLGVWFLAPREKVPTAKALAAALAVLIFVSVLLFTWFGHNWGVFSDATHAVSRFAARAGGEGHQKPFGYYLHLLDPMLVLIIIAVAGAYAALYDAVNRVGKAGLLVTIYGLVVFLIYSSIPYKTPWLALNMWLPLALMCGLGVAAFWDHIQNSAGRWIVCIAGAFLLSTLGAQTKALAFDRPADERNPFAYAHTGEDLLGLAPRIEQLAKANHLDRPRIAVIAEDAWPLPWYLREFPAVGFYQPGEKIGDADFFITTTDMSEELKTRLKDFRCEFFGVRPGVLIILWIPPHFKVSP